MLVMESRIPDSELLRALEDILSRVQSQGDSFVIEHNGNAVARIVPLHEKPCASLREALSVWRAAGPPDLAFADDLERVGALDRPPESAWAS
jgi:antitoxin (DNA-binding transcriptional repressor) of toxin-antitoxin stability system